MQTVINHDGGVQSVIQLNSDGSMTTGTQQDCGAILDYAKERHNSGQHGSAELKLAASIPHVIVEKYCNDHGIEFREFMQSQAHKKRLLNDPDLSYFRIWKGVV